MCARPFQSDAGRMLSPRSPTVWMYSARFGITRDSNNMADRPSAYRDSLGVPLHYFPQEQQCVHHLKAFEESSNEFLNRRRLAQ